MTILNFLVMTACVSTGKEVVSRSDGFSEKPAWALDSTELRESGGKIVMTGAAQMDGGANQVACLRAAGLDAQARLAKQLSSRVEGLAQAFQSTAGTDFDESLRNVFSAHLKDAAITGQYFERVVTTLPNESTDEKMECHARLELSGAAYRRLLQEVADSSKEAAVRAAMRKESERFFSSEATEPAH